MRRLSPFTRVSRPLPIQYGQYRHISSCSRTSGGGSKGEGSGGAADIRAAPPPPRQPAGHDASLSGPGNSNSNSSDTNNLPEWKWLLNSIQAGVSCVAERGPSLALAPCLDVWTSAYRPALFAVSAPPGAASTEGLTPAEPWELPAFTQQVAMVLQILACSNSGSSDGGGEDLAEYREEMRAFLLAVVDSQLPLCVAAVNSEVHLAEPLPPPTSTSTIVPTATPPPLRRGPAERVSQRLRPLPPECLLQLTVLVETLQAVLLAADPGRRTRHSLYEHAVQALGAADQLDSATLANLSTCLARCWQAAAAEMQLQTAHGGPRLAVRAPLEGALLPALAQRHRRSMRSGVSAVEAEEAEELQQLRGGLASAVQPLRLLSHQHVLAQELRERMAVTAAAAAATGPDKKEGGGGGKEEMLSSTIRAQQEALEGELGLLSLEERKRRTRQQQPTPTRTRRTLGSFHSSSTQGTPTESTSTIATPGERCVSLAQVAEMSSALGSMRYSDDAFWQAAVDFALGEARRLSDRPRSEGGEETLLMSVRDLAFAVGHVQQREQYDRLVKELVRLRLLQQYVPPPPPSASSSASPSPSGHAAPQAG